MRALLLSLLLAGGAVSAAAQAPAGPAPLERERFLGALAAELSAHFNLEGDLQLELIRPWTPPVRVAASWTIAVSEFPTLPSGSMLVRCRVFADGEPVADDTVLLRAVLWRDAWVTRQPIAAGATFDPELLEVRRTDLFREREGLPASVGDRAYVFARAVPAGRLLTWRDVTRRPLVRKGDFVEVTASEGPLLVTMKALALQSGAEGDTVTVRNPESRRDFAALVVDENRVQVRF